ncbi:MAG: phosphodiester glycosidase family protein, partial [Acidimicrobiales bacterium]
FTQDRHPRTMVGMTPAGEVLLVTADGRGASAGLSLIEAARLMADLGAVDAMNLDGGGSTTFVTGGVVRNAPSDGRERPVASSLAVLAIPPADPLTALLTDVANALTTLLQPAA